MMLEFINSNGVLFSGVFGIIATLITSIFAIIIDNKKSKQDTIRVLKKELNVTKKELDDCKAEIDKYKKTIDQYEKFQKDENNIDKTEASIYKETLPNGRIRNICGFCWEKEHIKIPINIEKYYEEYTRHYYYDGYCNACKSHCVSTIIDEPLSNETSDFEDENLPF